MVYKYEVKAFLFKDFLKLKKSYNSLICIGDTEMDKEVLDIIIAKLGKVKTTIETAIITLDVETYESPTTGKTIALDFDDTDLTNVQASIDEAVSQLQDLSTEIASYLME